MILGNLDFVPRETLWLISLLEECSQVEERVNTSKRTNYAVGFTLRFGHSLSGVLVRRQRQRRKFGDARTSR